MARQFKPPAILPEPDDTTPELRALNPRQQAFVMACVHQGLSNADAYRAAGYNAATAGHHAWQVARHPAVQRAIAAECRKLMLAEGAKSIRTLIAIRDDPTARNSDRLKSAFGLMDRAGLVAPSEQTITVEHKITNQEADRRIAAFFAERGVDPDTIKKLLVMPSDMRQNADGVYELLPQAETTDG